MKSNKDKAKLENKDDEENINFRSEEQRKEETIGFSETEVAPIVEPIPGTDDIDRKPVDNSPKEQINSVVKQIENTSVRLNDNPSLQSSDTGVGLIILGIVLIVLGAAVSAFIFALGGELLGLWGAIGIIPGVIALYFGLRRRNSGFSQRQNSGNRKSRINLFALFAWILIPACFLGILGIIVGPIILAFLIIATVQFKRNPGKYKGIWMVNVLWILIITAAFIYATTTLLVLLFW